MNTPTKFVNVRFIQGNYGNGWDDLTAGDSWKEIRDDLKAYRDNEPQYLHRVITRRITRANYDAGNY